MTRYIKLLLLIVFSSLTFYAGSAQVSALSGADFQAGRIIDDAVFFNRDSLTGSNIQAFMNSKVPVCDTWHAPGYGQNPPFTCLKDYRENTPSKAGEYGLCNPYAGGNKSSTEMIYDVSQICGINPKILLVLLQKEQSLVSDTWPLNSTLIKATGYGCPDSALPANVDGNQNGCYDEYEGFFNQIYMAARQYKKYARDAYQYNFLAGRNNYIQYHPNGACGGTNVYIQNQATAGLYNYTPYQPNPTALSNIYGSQNDGCSAYGNRNFWRMFNDWFGSPYGTSLVRTPSNPTYYLITNNKRYAIPNGDILYAYGQERTPLTIVSDNYLGNIADGGALSTIFTIPGDNTVYLADGGKKYGIASGAHCVSWGLPCGNLSVQKEIGQDISNLMPTGPPLQPIMLHQGSYFLMNAGKKELFMSPQAITERGYAISSHTNITSWTNAIRQFGPSLPEEASFVKFASSDAIYAYSNGNFYSVPNFETFRAWASPYINGRFDSVSTYNTTPPTVAGVLSTQIYDNSGSKYLVDGGRKINLTPVASNWPNGMNVTNLSALVSRVPTTQTAGPRTTFRSPDGSIFIVENNKRRGFNSVYDYYALGYTNADGLALEYAPLSIPIGAPLLAEGSGFKIQNGDTIYIIDSSNNAIPLRSVRQIYDMRMNQKFANLSVADSGVFTYPSSSLYDLATSPGGDLYMIYAGFKHPISPAMVTKWGIDTTKKITFSDRFLASIPTSRNLDAFLGSTGGTIYYGDNGTKRPIASFDKYRNIGGNNTNTLLSSNEFLSLIQQGTLLN